MFGFGKKKEIKEVKQVTKEEYQENRQALKNLVGHHKVDEEDIKGLLEVIEVGEKTYGYSLEE